MKNLTGLILLALAIAALLVAAVLLVREISGTPPTTVPADDIAHLRYIPES